MMETKILDAAKAYGAALNRPPEASGAAPEAPDTSFGDILKSTLGNVSEAGQTSETMVAQSLSGQANLLDVVTAVSNAELAVETVVAVRDKVITAYNEIMRMPI